MIAEKDGMLYMPRLLTVMLPAFYRVLLRKQFAFLALADERLHLLVQTQQSGLIDIVQHGRDEAVGNGHGHVDIDRLVVTHHVVHIAAVHFGHLPFRPRVHRYVAQRHRAGLHDEVVDRHLRRLLRARRVLHLAEIRVEACTQLSIIERTQPDLQQLVHVARLVHVIVRDRLLRLRQTFRIGVTATSS